MQEGPTRPVRAASVVFALAIALAAFVSPAGAETATAGASFTVAGGAAGPVVLNPAQATRLTYTVTNDSGVGETIAVRITGLEFVGETPEFTGHPSPGLSVQADPPQLSLPAGASHDVAVTLEAAPGSSPGSLYAGLVFQDVPSSATGKTTVVAAQARALLGHVPGATDDSGKIISFNLEPSSTPGGPLSCLLTFLDTGDIDYPTLTTVVLATAAGQRTEQSPASTVLPGNERTIRLTFPGPLPAGHIAASAHVVWGSSGEHSGDATASVDLVAAGTSQHPANRGGPSPTNLVMLNPPKGHFVHEWGLGGTSLLLLLIVVALLVRRYMEHRRNLRQVSRAARPGLG